MKSFLVLISGIVLLGASGCVFREHGHSGGYPEHGEYREHREHWEHGEHRDYPDRNAYPEYRDRY